MNHGDALLEAILAEPDDDAHRLVYADWLDEHGDADRAELIRVEVELSRLPGAHPLRRPLEAREAVLLAQHERAWAAPIVGLVERWRFRRGFVEEVALSSRQFVERGDELFALAPVRGVTLRRLHEGADFAGLLGLAEGRRGLAALLSRLTTLRLGQGRDYLPEWAGRALLSLPPLPRLRALDLGQLHLSLEGARALADSPTLGSLAALRLSLAAGPVGVEALLGSPHLGRLTALALPNSSLGDGVEVVTAAPVLARLTSLSLGHNGLTAAGVRRLVAAPAVARLEALDLSFNALRAEGALALTASPHLGAMADLNLSRTALGSAGARALARSPFLGRLLALDLSLNRIDDEGGRALAGYAHASRLVTLDLIYNHLGPAARDAVRRRFGESACLFSR